VIKLKSVLNVTVLLLAVFFAGVSNANAQFTPLQSASESWNVGHGDYVTSDGVPGCGNNALDPIQEAAKALAAFGGGGYWGALGSALNSAAQGVRPQTQGFAAWVLDQIYGGGRYANCVPVSVVIPAGSQIMGYRFEASDFTGSRLCVLGSDCQIGWSRFDPPQTTQAGNEVIVTSVFRNWSHDREREATFTVYFRQP
jgi:hypothetical protein